MAKVKTSPMELSTAPFSKDFLKDEVFAYPQFEELRQLVLRCINERSMAFIGGEAESAKQLESEPVFPCFPPIGIR